MKQNNFIVGAEYYARDIELSNRLIPGVAEA